MQSANKSGLFYGWVVVGVTVATLLVSAGIRAAAGVLIVPLEQDTGWSRTLIASAVSVGLLLFGFAGPLVGWLVDKLGPRLVMLAGLGLMIFSMVASALMQTPWQMLLFWGAVSGLATGLVGAVMGTAVANRWFYARRGMVLGIFGAATSAGQLIFLPGLMNFVGTLGSGFLTDRYDPRVLLACYYGFRGLSLIFLPFISSPLGLAFFAILFGLDYIATVPPTSALVADSFGRANAGTVFGWVFCAHQIGAALAAWLGGVARDLTGDYGIAFILAGVLAIAATGLSLGIRRAPVAAAPVAGD